MNLEIRNKLAGQRLKTEALNFQEEAEQEELSPLTGKDAKKAIEVLKKRIESLEELLEQKNKKQFKEAFNAVFGKEIKKLKNKKQ
tara:strand:+ start:106 stop:360 length:255 start_codon:yes stop_codon:yes gene_type:complete